MIELNCTNLHRLRLLLDALRALSHALRLTNHDMQLDRLFIPRKFNIHSLREPKANIVLDVIVRARLEVCSFAFGIGLFTIVISISLT